MFNKIRLLWIVLLLWSGITLAASTVSEQWLEDLINQIDQEVQDRENEDNNEVDENELLNSIKLLNQHEITKYDNEKDFRPDDTIRRDEAAKMYVRFVENVLERSELDNDQFSVCAFDDLNEAHSDLPTLLNKSCEFGLFKGSKWRFMPRNPITKWQAVVVLIRMLEWKQDEINVPHYATNYIKIANDKWLLKGMELDTNDYDVNASRSFVAKLLYRASQQEK